MGEYPLILNGVEPIHWLLAGAGIGLIVLILQWVANRSFGISAGLENLCGLFSNLSFFHETEEGKRSTWRLPFLVGLVGAGALSAVMGGGWEWTGDTGMLDRVFGLSPVGKTLWMFAGGMCIGFGTRLAGGCTSGHGIFGISTFQWPSLIATICFMTAGMGTTFFIYRFLAGG